MTGALAGPPATAQDIPNRKMWADRYLSAVCPVNAALDGLIEAWDASYGRSRVPIGTRTTPQLRDAYRVLSNKNRRAGLKFNRWKWPDPVARDARTMTRFYYRWTRLAENRSRSVKITRSWANPLPDDGNAGIRMRVDLKLPPPGRRNGCPR